MKFCFEQFSRVFNDVFTFEKPGTMHKYGISEVQIVEMRIPNDLEKEQAAELAKISG
jgi:hypothetical protein